MEVHSIIFSQSKDHFLEKQKATGIVLLNRKLFHKKQVRIY